MLGFKPFRVGKILGIDLTISWSFLVLVAAFSLYTVFQSGQLLIGMISGIVSLALLAVSVLTHELGHAIVARRLGMRIAEIELHLFGGAAKMLSTPRRPYDEMLIAVAGPLVSLTLAALFGVPVLLGLNPLGLFGPLALLNLMLGTFNLIPALPTDGGRILRAALTLKYGQLKATQIAVRVARVATIGVAVWAVSSGNFFALGIVVFLWILGTQELRMAGVMARQGSQGGVTTDVGAIPRGSRVEVYDRDGTFIGTAPGGAQTISSRVHPQTPDPKRSSKGWRRIFGQPAERRVYLRRPDGKLFVVSQGRSAWFS